MDTGVVAESAAALLGSFVASSAVSADKLDESNQPLKESLRPGVWAMSPGRVFSQAERSHFATVRWSWKGTRQVPLTKEEHFLQFVQARRPLGAQIPFVNLWNTWRDITSEYMRQYTTNQGSPSTFTTTIGPGEALFLPPAYIVCERGQGDNCVGLRLPVLYKEHHPCLLKVLNAVEKVMLGEAKNKALMAWIDTKAMQAVKTTEVDPRNV